MPEHLYIHVPFCAAKCAYCGFYSVTADPARVRRFPAALARELARARDEPADGRAAPVRTVYVGGGTPALLGADGLRALAAALRAAGALEALEEWTVELNPASVTPALLGTLRGLGVNRLSVGVQSFDDAALRRAGRLHDARQARAALRQARAAGFDNLGIDLIAGLPEVTPPAWRATLDEAAALGLQHLSVYALSVEPGCAWSAAAAAGTLERPGDEAQLEALADADARLSAAGFARYEISNYARPGMACRHNLGIWRGNDFLGVGPAAASRLGRGRRVNAADVDAYLDACEAGHAPLRESETLSASDDAAERALVALRLGEGLDLQAAAASLPALRPLAAAWERRLEGLAAHGAVCRSEGRWRLTARGQEVCDAVIRALL